MGYRFNPPPGWPPAPAGFTPPPDWKPDPSWPPAPPGWQLWVDDGAGQPAAPQAAPFGAPPAAPFGAPEAAPFGAPPAAPFGAPPAAPFGAPQAAPMAGPFVRPRARSRNLRRRRGFISLGVVAAIVVGTLIYNSATSAHRSSTGQITKNGNLGVTSLQAGDCFQNPANATSGTDITQVTAVSCATPHDAQVIALLPVSSSSYPDAATFKSQATSGCKTAAKDDVSQSQLTSTMDLTYFYPEESAWDGGQHSISCVIADSSKDLTSSLMK